MGKWSMEMVSAAVQIPVAEDRQHFTGLAQFPSSSQLPIMAILFVESMEWILNVTASVFFVLSFVMNERG